MTTLENHLQNETQYCLNEFETIVLKYLKSSLFIKYINLEKSKTDYFIKKNIILFYKTVYKYSKV